MPSRAERLLELFQGRTSDFALGRAEADDRSKVKLVYRPAGRPLTLDDLQAHMDGTGPIVGVYVLREDAECKFASFDIDKQDLLAAEKLRSVAIELGFPENAIMLVDSGNKGFHLHFFFADWQAAAPVRVFMNHVLKTAGMHERRNARDGDGVEVFPKQDDFSQHLTYGSLIKLPLVVHPASGRLAGIINARRIVPAPSTAVQEVLGAAGWGLDAHPVLGAPAEPAGATSEPSTTTGEANASDSPDRARNSGAPVGGATPDGSTSSLVMEGGRNAFLTSLAGKLRRDGMDQAAIEGILATTNQQVCVPPLPDREVRTIARSVSRYPIGEGDLRLKPPPPAHIKEEGLPSGATAGVEVIDGARGYNLNVYGAGAEAKGTNWLIDEWLIKGQLHLTVGQEKLGKSTQAWHRIAAVSGGEPYLARYGVRPGRVVVMTEMNPDTIHTLLADDDIYPDLDQVTVMFLDEYEPRQRIPKLRTMLEAKQPTYCLLDPIDECLGFDADGVWNSSTVAAGMDGLRDLMRDGLCIEGLYHFNKGGKVANSYKFTSKVDHIYEVKGEKASDVTIKFRGRTRAIPKVRRVIGNGHEGYEIQDLERMPVGRPSKRQTEALDWMRGAGEVGIKEVAEALGLSYQAAKQLLFRMANIGSVTRVGEGAFLYKGVSLPSLKQDQKDGNKTTNKKLSEFRYTEENEQGFGAQSGNETASGFVLPRVGSWPAQGSLDELLAAARVATEEGA